MKNTPVRFTKVDRLLSRKKQITKADLDFLSKPELQYFDDEIQRRGNQLTGENAEAFWHHIDLIMDQPTKNQLWEMNHSNITWAISKLIQELGRMPSKTEIATKVDLSRQTVHKHLSEYTTHPLFVEQKEQFKFMADKLLAKVLYFALEGDVSAAKLYFSITGNNNHPGNNTLIRHQQNNFIQINGTVISQETVKQLNPDQLNIIEGILKTAAPQPQPENNISNL